MVRRVPKLLAAGAITGFTDTTHVVAHWIAHVFSESPVAGPSEEIAAWALVLTTVLLGLRVLRILGKILIACGNACLWIPQATDDALTKLEHVTERLIRRGLLKVSASLRHLGLKLAR